MTVHTHCQQCGRPKTLPRGKQRYVELAVYEADEFCSRACCEAAYQVEQHAGPYTRNYTTGKVA